MSNNQLSLLDSFSTASPQSKLTSVEAYEIITQQRRPKWDTMLKAVAVLEPSLKQGNYPKNFKTPEELLETLPDTGYYIAALKAVWWNRLVFVDRTPSFLNYEDIKLNSFLRVFNIMKFGKKTKRLQVNKDRVPVAKFHYRTAQALNGKLSTKTLWDYADNYQQLEVSKEIKALEFKVSQLEWQLFNAQRGILKYHGYDSKNLEINPKYIELYALAKKTSMSSIQHSVFLDILFFQGYYPACQYLGKFNLESILGEE